MTMIRHVNIMNADGEVYCCLRNRIVRLDDDQRLIYCNGCKMYDGDAEGRGVACVWDDVREVDNPHIVRDPQEEWSSNQTKTTPNTTLGLQGPEQGYGLFIAANFT